jgi:parvulin-like peptidyl-prolyl isomerase
MKRQQLIIIILFFLFVYPSCKDDSAENRIAKLNQEKKQEQEAIDNSIILQIDEKKISNKDLKKYIRINYSDISETETNKKLLSRIFDSFIEYKITTSTAELAKIPVQQEEFDQYIIGLNIQKEKIDRVSIITSIKLQKYLDAYVYKDIDVSQKEIREYYNKNHAEFTKKKEVLLYQILIKDKEKALSIRSILEKNPNEFEELAMSHSVSNEAKDGGLLGYFEEGILPNEMEDVVFSLKLNEISPVTESPYGFHIFKVTKQKKSGRLLFIKNVELQISNKLLSRKLREAYQVFLNNLKSKFHIEIGYNNLYFKYQALKGEIKDENTQEIPANNSSGNTPQ